MPDPDSGFTPLRVDCYAGHRGEETPRRFYLGKRPVEIAAIIDCWLEPDHRYFKVEDAEGNSYILRHEAASRCWELTSYKAGPYK